jgi:threonyl-tRNA synthetase
MLVVGDREVAESAVAVRSRAKGDLGARPFDDFLSSAVAEVGEKTLS